MHIITDIDRIKALTRRGQKRTVIDELKRRKIRHEIAHDGWPIVFISDAVGLPSNRPNFEALRKG